MEGLVYPELSYTLNGIFFDVQNQLGTKFQEKHYVRAASTILKEKNIFHELEVPFMITFKGQFLGKFKADMIVEKLILIEFKTVPFLTTDHRQQMLRYLKANNLKLGLLVNFRKRPLEI